MSAVRIYPYGLAKPLSMMGQANMLIVQRWAGSVMAVHKGHMNQAIWQPIKQQCRYHPAQRDIHTMEIKSIIQMIAFAPSVLVLFTIQVNSTRLVD